MLRQAEASLPYRESFWADVEDADFFEGGFELDAAEHVVERMILDAARGWTQVGSVSPSCRPLDCWAANLATTKLLRPVLTILRTDFSIIPKNDDLFLTAAGATRVLGAEGLIIRAANAPATAAPPSVMMGCSLATVSRRVPRSRTVCCIARRASSRCCARNSASVLGAGRVGLLGDIATEPGLLTELALFIDFHRLSLSNFVEPRDAVPHRPADQH